MLTRRRNRAKVEKKDTIRLLVTEIEDPMPGRRAMPGSEALTTKVVDLQLDVIRKGIQEMSGQVAQLVQNMPNDNAAVRLDEVSIDVAVSANGTLQWVAGVGVEVGSTMTLTFKVAGLSDEG